MANGQQGNGNWFYGYHNVTLNGAYNGTNFIPFPTDQGAGISATDFWAGTFWDWGGPGGNPPWTFMSSNQQHPNSTSGPQTHWTVRRYLVNVPNGTPTTASINYTIRDAQAGGNGINGRIYVNGVQLSPTHFIGGNDAVGITNTLNNIVVSNGTLIDMIVDPFSDDGNDNTEFFGTITVNFNPNLVPEPSTVALFGLGLTGMGVFAWRRRRA